MIGTIFEKLTDILLISFQNRRILKHLPKKMETIVDVGAHEGQMFISLNKFKTEFNKIIVFEPFKASFNKIMELNSNKIVGHNIAIGAKIETKNMKINKYNVTNTFAEPNENLIKFKIKNLLFNFRNESSYFANEVHNVATLDSYLDFEDGEYDLLKIDTEGYELDVLQGAKELFKQGKVKNIIIELHKKDTYKNYDPNDIDKFLKNFNFRLVKDFNIYFLGFKDSLYTRDS
ncbi:FkbM family methyltransferase [Acidimicrobiia bacterium]|jgi:FkbM family methyltransferase|nr:FkbM family methyltransferase [Acidimicrobiia bacterium]